MREKVLTPEEKESQPGRAPMVLYIEDNWDNFELVRRILEADGFRVEHAPDGIEGVRKAVELRPDLILMDIGLPGLSGYELTAKLRSREETKQIPIVALTAHVGPGDRERALAIGCDGYIGKPIDIETFPNQVRAFLRGEREEVPPEVRERYLQEHQLRVIDQLEHQIVELKRKQSQLEEYAHTLEKTYIDILASLTRALEAKDPYTAGHSERVTFWAVSIGQEMRLSNRELLILERSGLLHDIGKLVIDLSYINKEGPLTEEEWAILAKHPVYSAQIIEPLSFLSDCIEPVRHHHERYDGKGYPDGLGGDQLGIHTWILGCADAIDAMLSHRSYKKALTFEQVLDELEIHAGSQFHPQVARVASELIRKRGYSGHMNPTTFNGWDIERPLGFATG